MNLNLESKIRILFIVNPYSGVMHKKHIDKYLKKMLRPEKFDYKIVFTKYKHHAIELSRQGVDEGYKVFVAVGGDGTVNEVARPLVGSDFVLGIIPFGSGNGLARHLQIPLEIEKAIGVISKINIKRIDTAYANEHLFLSIAGIGFDAHVADLFSKQSQRGFLGYAKVSLREYFRYRPKAFRLIIDGKKMKKKAFFISFANSDQFGYNASIAPDAKVDDGLIDVVIVNISSFLPTVLFASLLFFKKIRKTPYVEVIKTPELVIKQKMNIINLDGEPIKIGKKIKIRVNPASLNVIVP
ncbi:MAG TPA: diacylglycerol kinase family lipid kinase [Bacteroidales bacterium]|jgi:diacylglycerol kinase (ATP)|nr:diacylglycerol kinase family lipid kinase [Lentimicrobium sp.]HOF80325.1 diacylglycerol kinase family lipid kinase [Bacteroidales bacterium]HQF00902.1 diacylglycerol kinase family lipid kinase [Bacteroidales bacterium]HQH14049.1 diacylglycerol kinase family lipid kinase [Bacteroidales bacterium]